MKAIADHARPGRAHTLDVIHLSHHAGLTVVDPACFGRGKATRYDLRGENKSFFFLRGSPLGQDTYLFQGALAYRATVPTRLLYDTREGDSLGYLSELNRRHADLRLQALGYAGTIVRRYDGATCLLLFIPVHVIATPRSSLTRAL